MAEQNSYTERTEIQKSGYFCRLIKQPCKEDPFYLEWKDGNTRYSFGCSGGRFDSMAYTLQENEIELIFTLAKPIDSHHPVENRELIFYCAPHHDIKPTVEGVRATTFKLGEAIGIDSKLKLTITFKLLDGEGRFLGHIMMGSRNSPKAQKIPPSECDWLFLLRTIDKKQPCTIQVSITIDS